MSAAFCPSCGTARTGSFRFCRSCGFDFDTLGAAAPVALPPPVAPSAWASPPAPGAQPGWTAAAAGPGPAALTGDAATYRLLTMLAWLGSALCLGWLVLIQLSFVGTIVDNGSFALLAGWNGLMAALILYGAVKLGRSATRSSFRQSAIWALVIVLIQGLQIAGGATHIAYVLATVAAAGAGILAWLTYGALPPETQRA